MTETFLGVLTGFGIFVFTELFKLLKKRFPKLSMRYVVLGLVALSGTVFYIIESNDPAIIDKVGEFMMGAFGSSQMVWLIIEKYLPQIINDNDGK